MRHFALLSCFVFLYYLSYACDCPPAGKISSEKLQHYDVIFKGRTDSVVKNKVWFAVEALFRGKSNKSIAVIFDDSTDCRMSFSKGETWLIYSEYVSFGNLAVDFCSRSRKKFDETSNDFYTVNNECSFEDEILFLEKNMGKQALSEEKEKDSFPERELIRPKGFTVIWLLAASLAGFLLIYFVFKKYLGK